MMTEKTLYESLWATEEYRQRSPGMDYVEEFVKTCRVKPHETIADVGCGTGRVAQWLHEKGFTVTAIDLAGNCLDEGISVPFEQIDITQSSAFFKSFDWIFCADVLEHIPAEDVPAALNWMASRMRKGAFLVIPMFPAERDGEVLHKTVKDQAWWAEQFKDMGFYEGFHVTMLPTGDNRRLIVRIEKR